MQVENPEGKGMLGRPGRRWGVGGGVVLKYNFKQDKNI
jgi:hypothetical protein